MITCDYWKECGVTGGGCCTAGHYGGQPSFGVCNQCEHRSIDGVVVELTKEQTTMQTIKHYAEGAVKAIKAMTLPETEESKARLVVCVNCDKWTGTSCKVCGCYVNLKVKIPEEKCPEGKW